VDGEAEERGVAPGGRSRLSWDVMLISLLGGLETFKFGWMFVDDWVGPCAGGRDDERATGDSEAAPTGGSGLKGDADSGTCALEFEPELNACRGTGARGSSRNGRVVALLALAEARREGLDLDVLTDCGVPARGGETGGVDAVANARMDLTECESCELVRESEGEVEWS